MPNSAKDKRKKNVSIHSFFKEAFKIKTKTQTKAHSNQSLIFTYMAHIYLRIGAFTLVKGEKVTLHIRKQINLGGI